MFRQFKKIYNGFLNKKRNYNVSSCRLSVVNKVYSKDIFKQKNYKDNRRNNLLII